LYIQDKVSWNGDVANKLRLLKTLGVDCVAMDIPDGPRDGGAINLSTLESATAFFRKAKSAVAAHGMDLRTVLATSGFDEIKRGLPGRDRQIAWLLNAVQAMGAAGIPILAYNFKLLNSKLLRSAPSNGRGGAKYISFDYDEYLKNPAPPIEPPVSEEKMWDNIAYFLKAVVPAAEKAGVRLALHPDDPPVPYGTPALAGAAYSPSQRHVNPGLLTQALAQAAQRRGARLRHDTPALGLLTSGRRVTGVRTGGAGLVPHRMALPADDDVVPRPGQDPQGHLVGHRP